MTLKVLLADDHFIIRQGLKNILKHENWLEVVGEAEDGRQVLKMAKNLNPDIVIIDIGMPELNGIEATRQIRNTNPDTKILALSIHNSIQFIEEMLDAGASGYLLKDCAVEELIKAIKTITKDNIYIAESLRMMVSKHLTDFKPGKSKSKHILSTREKEVLQLIAEGNATRIIAEKLFLSPKTVEAHRKNIMDKLNLFSLPELTQYALKSGIIQIL